MDDATYATTALDDEYDFMWCAPAQPGCGDAFVRGTCARLRLNAQSRGTSLLRVRRESHCGDALREHSSVRLRAGSAAVQRRLRWAGGQVRAMRRCCRRAMSTRRACTASLHRPACPARCVCVSARTLVVERRLRGSALFARALLAPWRATGSPSLRGWSCWQRS